MKTAGKQLQYVHSIPVLVELLPVIKALKSDWNCGPLKILVQVPPPPPPTHPTVILTPHP